MDLCKHELDPGTCATCAPGVQTATVRLQRVTPAPRRTSVRYWSPEEDEFAADLTISDEEIADLFGRTPVAVHMHRLYRGFVTKRNEREIADAERAMARWTPQEVQYAREQAARDVPFAQIGLELGRSEMAVRARLYRPESED